jgi:hypothetical protein
LAKHQYRAELVSGPDNLSRVKEKASQSYVLKYSSGACQALTTTTAIDSPYLGVAARDGQNTATASMDDKYTRVYVFSSEQVWRIHAKTAKKPSSYAINSNYGLLLTSNASFAITPIGAATSTTVSVKGPVVDTAAAGTGVGVVVVGWDSAGYNKKGQCLLVRFANAAWGS